MNYYLLGYSDDEKDNLPKGQSPILVNSYELYGFDLRTLWRGKYIEKWPDNLELYYDKGNVFLDYIPNVLSWLIFSNKVIAAFNQLNVVGIQCFPINICSIKNKKKHCSAYVVNTLESVSALDWEKSDYVSWEDDPKYIKFIRKIVLKTDCDYRNLDMFRLGESKNYIIVSERIKKCLKMENLTGFGLLPLEIS